MPYEPTTPTLVLCDDLVDALREAWSTRVAPSGVERAYFRRIGDKDNPETDLKGRQVVIFPTGYGNNYETRGEDLYTHRVSVLTVERFPDAGDPPDEWTDERVDFVHTHIVQGFDFGRNGPASFNPGLVTLSADVVVCDIEKLVTGGKLFYSLVELEFSELRTA